MPRRKLARFEYNSLATNVIERGKPEYTAIKGNWKQTQFKNSNPIHLELACGRGEYTVGLAAVHPNINYIGVDIKGDRIARGSQKAAHLPNAAFLRTGIDYIEEFFTESEVSEIWLIHPDPQPLEKWEKKRLTYAKYLDIYKRILIENGIVRLKTDDLGLFEYSLKSLVENGFEILESTTDLYLEPTLLSDHHQIETYYEKKFTALGRKINYLIAKKKGAK